MSNPFAIINSERRRSTSSDHFRVRVYRRWGLKFSSLSGSGSGSLIESGPRRRPTTRWSANGALGQSSVGANPGGV